VDNVAGQPAEAKRHFPAEKEERADENQQSAKCQKGAAEFTKRIHTPKRQACRHRPERKSLRDRDAPDQIHLLLLGFRADGKRIEQTKS